MQQKKETTRYNIATRIDRLPRERRSSLLRQIRTELNIPRSTWSRWMRVKESASADIPGRALRVIARRLGTDIAELFNDPKQEA